MDKLFTQATFQKHTTQISGLLVLLMSLLIMTGWLLQLQPLVSPFGMGVSRFNTALMGLLLSVSLFFMGIRLGIRGILLQGSCLGALLLLSGVTLMQYLLQRPLGIDELFFTDWMPAEQGKFPGRPSPATSLCFFALALALSFRYLVIISLQHLKKHGYFIQPSPWLTGIFFALYASLVMATAISVFFSIVVWLTDSADSIFGNLSLGQSLLTASLLLVACSGLLIGLLRNDSFDVTTYWMPTATFFSFVALGLILSHNIPDRRQQQYSTLIGQYITNIKQLAYAELERTQQELFNVSWRNDNTLLHESHLPYSRLHQKIQGLKLLQQGGTIQQYGLDTTQNFDACSTRPVSHNWYGDYLVIVQAAAKGNPWQDLCLAATFHYSAFLQTAHKSLDLSFRIISIRPASSLTPAQQSIAAPASGEQRVTRQLNFSGQDFIVQLEPRSETAKTFEKDLSAFFITLSLLFGALAAVAIYMLLISRRHYRETLEANSKLSQLEARNRKVLEMAPEAVILVNPQGKISYCNQRSMEIFGYLPENLIDQPLEVLLPEALRNLHQQHREHYMQDPITREMGENLPLEARHQSGHVFPVDIVLSPIEFDDEKVVMAIIRDISDKVQEKQRIRKDLQEKEILLKEVYHRVKNNMQVIASLLRMQSRSAEHLETRNSLTEAALRISALALVHEKLYQSTDLSQASIKSYIESLTESLRQNYLGSSPLQIQIEAPEEKFEPEVIMPIGLIMNELISNAMKHAFKQLPQGDAASIQVTFQQQDDGRYCLSVCDNGCGLPEGFDIKASKSLGLKLIKSLSLQLKAEMSFDNRQQGACFTMLIPRHSMQPSASPMVSSGMKEPVI